MIILDSFPAPANVAVIGASGGIGRAMLGLLAGDERVQNIYGFARSTPDLDLPRVTIGHIDIESEAAITEAAGTIAEPLDLVIVASGILWQGDTLRPEKSMRDLDADSFARLFSVNSIGPALIAKHFLPKLRRKSKTVFAAISARVGSISDNRLGGWYAYRASKAALNMVLKSLAIEHARRFPDSVVAGLHPGTVDTRLSQPYTGRTPRERLFDADTSARHLLNVINSLTPDDSGGVFAWDGSRIES